MYSIVSIVCDHRNAQKRSSNNPQPADVEYETPNPTGQDDQQSQYEHIQLDQIQPGPDAARYHSLSPETRGEQHQYEAIPRPEPDNNLQDYIDYYVTLRS